MSWKSKTRKSASVSVPNRNSEYAKYQVLAILDPQMSQQDLGKALQTRLPHTRRLIHRFTELASGKGIRSAASEELQSRCMKLQAEVSASVFEVTN
jgi:hypothetical protein